MSCIELSCCAKYGAHVKPPAPQTAQADAYRVPVQVNYRRTLARNVAALMKERPELGSHAKLAKRCSTATRKIGARTIGHLLNVEDGPQPQLDTIVAVAEAFSVTPWQLLRPDFDAKNPGASRAEVTPAVLELAKQLGALSQDRRDLLMDLFQGDGERAAQALHSPRPRSYKIKEAE